MSSSLIGDTKLNVVARVEGNRIIEAMDFESDTKNWKFPFDRMCKFYGKDFIDMIKTMWEVNYGVQTEEEFCEMNGIPKKFFDKHINK